MTSQHATAGFPIAVFIGRADAGPVGEEVRVETLRQFEAIFGSAVQGSYLAIAVSQFFRGGGAWAYILRLAEAAKSAEAVASIACVSLSSHAADQSEASVRRVGRFLASDMYHEIHWPAADRNMQAAGEQAQRTIEAFLHTMFVEGAFAGTTPHESYFVKFAADNNPAEPMSPGIINITVGFAPLYPAEFIVIEIQQWMTFSSGPQETCNKS